MLYYTSYKKIYDTKDGLQEANIFNWGFLKITDLAQEIKLYKDVINPTIQQLGLNRIKGLCFYNRKGEPKRIIWL